MNRSFVFVILVLVSFPSFPSETSTFSPASFVTVQSNNIALVYFPNAARTGTIPSCTSISGSYFAFAFSLTTEAGKAMFAEIISLRESGQPYLYAVGTGDCGLLSGIESLSIITGPQ